MYGEPDFASGPPTTAEEYLRRVRCCDSILRPMSLGYWSTSLCHNASTSLPSAGASGLRESRKQVPMRLRSCVTQEPTDRAAQA